MKFQKGSTPANFKDLTGQTFGRLSVVSRLGSRNGKAEWLCKCECGKQKHVTGDNLQQGQISCGCAKTGNSTHGKTDSRTYSSWRNMLNRCRNSNVPAYKNYGGRGIFVCERWHSFENFLSDMGESPTGYEIERIDNNGNYEPSNCKWIPGEDQAKNRRCTIIVEGLLLPELSVKYGLKIATLRYRIKYGVPLDKRLKGCNH